MDVKVTVYGVSIPQRVNGNGRHKFYKGYVEEQLLILSYCQRVNGYGRHKFYKCYVEEKMLKT